MTRDHLIPFYGILIAMNYTNIYTNKVMSLPMLEDDSLKTKEDLILSHLKLVASIAHKQFRNSEFLDDAIQEGNVALIKAAKSFNVTRGVPFASYAIPYIKYAMGEAYTKRNMIKTLTTKPLKKAHYHYKDYSDIMELPLSEEVARKMASDLSIKVSDIREYEKRRNSVSASFDATDDFVLEIPDDRYEPVNVLVFFEREHKLESTISDVMKCLTDRDRDIFVQRWISDNKPSRAELGKVYKISGTRVEQIENAILKKIREKLVSFYDVA